MVMESVKREKKIHHESGKERGESLIDKKNGCRRGKRTLRKEGKGGGRKGRRKRGKIGPTTNMKWGQLLGTGNMGKGGGRG